ncbi:MAG: formylglycine-generating enzyme family protein [Bacteroidales bacterium]|jgi:formylglycine-generating enzyme required for sulfatase activity|nr:formylglycine-generating enzyme family protein [Bacteroidales bacterium]
MKLLLLISIVTLFFGCNSEVLDKHTNFVERFDNIPIEMIAVEGGKFKMGSSEENLDKDIDSDERPQHKVRLSSFHISKYEITQKQWKAVMGNNPSYFKGDNLPVEQVNMSDINEFLMRLNTKTGKKYRLPTESEWEYAALGGGESKGYKYSGSNNVDEVAWHKGNSSEMTHPIGEKQPNELGIYDMSGNVWEWCSDKSDWYDNSSKTNPKGPSTGSSNVRRGGGFTNGSSQHRSANRAGISNQARSNNLGFRIVLP